MKMTAKLDTVALCDAITAYLENRCYDGTEKTQGELNSARAHMGFMRAHLLRANVNRIEVPLDRVATGFEFEVES